MGYDEATARSTLLRSRTQNIAEAIELLTNNPEFLEGAETGNNDLDY